MLKVIIHQETVDQILICYAKAGMVQRLGQYFLNNIDYSLSFPELFYETDNNKAWELIEQNFKIIP